MKMLRRWPGRLPSTAAVLALLATSTAVAAAPALALQSPGRTVVLTLSDSGRTVHVARGDLIELRLQPQPGFQPWSAPLSSRIGAVAELAPPPVRPFPLLAALNRGSATITSSTTRVCTTPLCGPPIILRFSATVVVGPGARPNFRVEVGLDDLGLTTTDRLTLHLRVGDGVLVDLGPDWTTPASDHPGVLQPEPPPPGPGSQPVFFDAVARGVATVSATFDPACFHAVPPCQIPSRPPLHLVVTVAP